MYDAVSNASSVSLQVMNLGGEIVQEQSKIVVGSTVQYSIPLREFASGVYIFAIVYGNKIQGYRILPIKR